MVANNFLIILNLTQISQQKNFTKGFELWYIDAALVQSFVVYLQATKSPSKTKQLSTLPSAYNNLRKRSSTFQNHIEKSGGC